MHETWLAVSCPQDSAGVDPHVCRCHCDYTAPEPRGQDAFVWYAFFFFGIILLGAHLIVVFRVSIKRTESGDQETLSEGKPGKGIYGSSKGQILDH